jgi:acetolactate synthase-1/2/3 large subunit
VREFCEKNNIPLVTTMMGIGVMPKKHPLYFGMLGNNGKPYANRAVANSDLLIVAGARIADRAVPKPENLEKQVNIIHIDIDSAEIGKNLGPTIPLVGDIKNIFSSLLESDIHIDTGKWIEDLEEIKRSTVDHRVFSDKLVNPMILVQTLSEKMDDNAVYVADVGQNQLWSADNYVMKAGRFLTTGGMGTMGYSIPAAIGVKVCRPELQVVAVCGDGDFQMSMFELGTMAVNKIPLKILVMRNQYLGLVREHQEKTYQGHYSGVQLDKYPNYEHLAAAYDMDYFHAQENDELDAELDRFLASENASIMVCEIDSFNKVK